MRYHSPNYFLYHILLMSILVGCSPSKKKESKGDSLVVLTILQDEGAGTLSVFRKGSSEVLVTQNAKPNFRPYLHPINSPDGKGQLTEYSPGHHKHQTGLYWGFTRVNGEGAPMDTVHKYFYKKDKFPEMEKSIGRDFFHHPEGEYWK